MSSDKTPTPGDALDSLRSEIVEDPFRLRRDVDCRNRIKSGGQELASRGTRLSLTIDRETLAKLVVPVEHDRWVVYVSEIAALIDKLPGGFHRSVVPEEMYEKISLAESAAYLGISVGALQRRVWRARKRGEWTPFFRDLPGTSYAAYKLDLEEWRKTWTGRRKPRASASEAADPNPAGQKETDGDE